MVKVVIEAKIEVPDTFGYSVTEHNIIIRVLDRANKAHSFPTEIKVIDGPIKLVNPTPVTETEE